jgi:hypothetical protein
LKHRWTRLGVSGHRDKVAAVARRRSGRAPVVGRWRHRLRKLCRGLTRIVDLRTFRGAVVRLSSMVSWVGKNGGSRQLLTGGGDGVAWVDKWSRGLPYVVLHPWDRATAGAREEKLWRVGALWRCTVGAVGFYLWCLSARGMVMPCGDGQ